MTNRTIAILLAIVMPFMFVHAAFGANFQKGLDAYRVATMRLL